MSSVSSGVASRVGYLPHKIWRIVFFSFSLSFDERRMTRMFQGVA